MVRKFWWLVHKDLVSEWRARQVWPAMLLMGAVVATLFGLIMDLPAGTKERAGGGLLWLAIFLAGILALDRSLASEREGGCWDAFLLFPVPPETLYLAKVTVNVMTLGALQCLIIPVFGILADLPLGAHPEAILLVAFLGNVGIASLGTLMSALVGGVRHGGKLLAVLVLPAAVPVVLAAAEASRLAMLGDFNASWQRWAQLLGGFAVVYTVAGTVLFGFALEE